MRGSLCDLPAYPPLGRQVIPAQAGIQFCFVYGIALDSRLRGKDGYPEKNVLACV